MGEVVTEKASMGEAVTEEASMGEADGSKYRYFIPADGWQVEENDHPIEQVRLTVDPTDNPNLTVLTWRSWVLGVISCVLLSFANTFFGYRSNPIFIGSVCVQIITLPIGRFLAGALPNKRVQLIPFAEWSSFSLNPGPFSMKEHCIITIFAGAGAGGAAATGIVSIVKAYYHREINPVASFLLVQTTQLLGYSWAGIFRKYLVDSPYMWWPSNLVQVSLFKALHLNEKRKKGCVTRFQFFMLVFIGSFAYYTIPGFLFPSISIISVICLLFKNSVTMQQIGSGLNGLGVGSFGLDWSTVAGFLGSPLATPATAIINTMVSFVLVVYVFIPLGYWNNIYNVKRFPLISAGLFDDAGQHYNISRIINARSFTLNVAEQENYSKLNLTISFGLVYAMSFASLTAAIMHVALHNGRDIWKQWKNTKDHARENGGDVHSRLMKRNYEPVPEWWFLLLLAVTIGLSLLTCLGFSTQMQLPWWGVFLAGIMAFCFTLPIGVIVATTNQGTGLNVISEYIIGLMLPGKPLANVTFKIYATISMWQALTLLSDLNLGLYMKIPPKSMFLAQLAGTIISASVSYGTTMLLLDTVKHICDPSQLPQGSPWTCPGYDVFYNASIIWGLVGPMRMFGKLGRYSALNFFFLIGLLLPIPFWLLAKAFPRNKWIKYIHIPLLVSSGSSIPPVHTANYIMWGSVGLFFNYYIYKRHKGWWARHTYVMSAALDAGVAFMGILIFFTLQSQNIFGISWWGGAANDHCPLATCPTALDVLGEGCPVM